ncbi:hypothetical protein OESDEN_02604 [Oesophagostomum dentatum]|uniref:Gamma-glutamyltranspeptidase n=1 Tax=Oesophagostomum dentatum TaxID=61180 RepID=A0A0B1TNJ6_OESDE|nr:hypothetical protein OESDEN_02604 [Oesophagostomum dentatum]
MVVGGTGGSKIISAVAKAIIRHLFFGETLKEAIDAPMLHHQFIPFYNMIDGEFPKDLKSVMESKYGHEFRNNTGFRGVVHAVTVEEDGIHACGDFRRTTPQVPDGV